MKCDLCGKEVGEGQKFCKYCGQPIKAVSQDNVNSERANRKLKILIAILTLILICIAALLGVYYISLQKNDTESIQNKTVAEKKLHNDESEKQENDSNESGESEENNDQYENIIKAEEPVACISMNDISVSCSSSLSEAQYNIYHVANNLIDGDLTTAWVEGVNGQGVGQYLTFIFKNKGLLSNIAIHNGYQKTEDTYNKNSRPKEITITFGDDISKSYTLDDILGEQVIELEDPVETDKLTIVIDSVYPGYKFEDTAISEIKFY